MKKLSSREKILFGVYSMVMAMIGDYLLGYQTFGTSKSPDAYMGISWNVAPDWRYAVSSVLGFLCAALFAVAAMELFKVMEKKLPVVFNAGMEATGDIQTSADMVFRVLKSIAVPLTAGFIICDLFVTIAWIGMVMKKMIPVKKIAFLCCPIITSVLGQLMNYISEGLDSGFESFGWLLMYLVCAIYLIGAKEEV